MAENDDGYKAKSYAAFCCNFREIVYELLHLQEQESSYCWKMKYFAYEQV